MRDCKKERTDSYNELLEKFLKLKIENDRLEKQNEDIQNNHMKLCNDTKDEIRKLKEENEKLEKQNKYILNDFRNEARKLDEENDMLRAEIQRLREKCGEVPVDTEKSCIYDISPDYEKLCRELQDQHQQGCIRINDLTTTVNVLTGLYVNLRKNIGVD